LLYQRPGIKRLASGAEVGAAVLHQDPLDGAAANGAGLASLVNNLKIEMGCAQLALRADIGIHAGALLIQMPFRSLDKRAEYIYHFRRYDSGDEKRCHSRGDKRSGAEG